MSSKFYKSILRREKVLRNKFINKRVYNKPQTMYSQDMLKSYRILIHAELENYFENFSVQIAEKALEVWNNRKYISIVILSILAYCEYDFKNIGKRLNEIDSGNDLNFRINKAISCFRENIKLNNGIKEQDIIPIIVKLGIDYRMINQTLLSNLSAYGALRGDVAHKSYKVISIIDPSDEVNKVNQIINELISLDELILKLLRNK